MKKNIVGLAVKYVFLLLLALFVMYVLYVVGALFHPPGPQASLSNMERLGSKTARKMIDSYAEELKAVTSATELMESDEEYHYCLNFTDEYAGADRYQKQLQEMPRELVDALGELEQKFPEFSAFLWLKKGQIGVSVSNGSRGESYLCYPGENLIMEPWIWEDGTETMRHRDMGDGWELQMFYMPKG
ncbi:MAG: hypothetical protein HFF51_01935 [Lawsonibacter sp.]|nr:hypothetical protein [Lawsonibacter sp.]